MADKMNQFKRLNFFEGFVTTPDDWNQGEEYHVEKHRLHNRAFHGYGVVAGQLEDFYVSSRGKGELAVEVRPGYAIDGQGNDIILWETEIRPFIKTDYKLPQTVYLIAKFVDEPTDFVAYKENLNYKGHTRRVELAKVDWSITEPNVENEVELARIHVSEDAKRFTDARDPENPQENEIDLRYVPQAGVAGGFLGAGVKQQFRNLLRRNRDLYGALYTKNGIASANNVVQALVMMDMLMSASAMGPSSFLDLIELVLEQKKKVLVEIEKGHPGLSSKKKFRDYKSEIELIDRLVGDRREALLVLEEMMKHQELAVDALESATKEVTGPGSGGAKPKKSKKKAGDFSWETIKTHSSEMPKLLTIDGIEWELVDQIDLLDESSEKAHNFRIHGEKDSWHTRQRLKYPDGTLLEDAGVAHVDGYAEWEIKNMKKSLDLLVIRRMDFVHGDHKANIEINGVKCGKLVCEGSDKRFRWRNWPFVIKGKYIRSSSVTMRQVATSAERDINLFHLWFYQAT